VLLISAALHIIGRDRFQSRFDAIDI
jgi:hypothetical protein